MRRFRSSPHVTASAALAVILLVLAPACSKQEKPTGQTHGGTHAHTAPHGGTLIELGDHAYNLELVRDAASGKLTAYVLDGHAEHFIRLKAPAFELVASGGPEKRVLLFRATANAATGETVGNTSQFEAQADWLKTEASFDATLTALEIRGTNFTSIPFNFPRGAKK
jgi:hypothetical protein